MITVDSNLAITHTVTLPLGTLTERKAAIHLATEYKEHLMAWLTTGVEDPWWAKMTEREVRRPATLQEILSTASAIARFDRLPLLDVFITDRCNITCDRCNAGVHLGTPNVDANPVDIANAVNRLAELMPPPTKVNVIGGEPLLHPGLAMIANDVRRTFPNTTIDVFTNGLLIPQRTDVLPVLGRLKINLQMSIYGPHAKFINADVRRRTTSLDCQRCAYHVGVVDRNLRYMDVCCTHPLMPSGDLWYCGGIIQLRLGIGEVVRGVEGDVVNIHEISADELHRFLTKPTCPATRWCAPDGEVRPWRLIRR